MPTLEHAIAIAARAHAGQLDKGGAPYILHPLRVMLRVEGELERLAAGPHGRCLEFGHTRAGHHAVRHVHEGTSHGSTP